MRTAEVIIRASERKREIVTALPVRALEPSELHLSSSRSGSAPGTHTVSLDGPDDTIELTHTARSRNAFASGAVRVAEWMAGKTGFFTMDDFLAAQQL